MNEKGKKKQHSDVRVTFHPPCSELLMLSSPGGHSQPEQSPDLTAVNFGQLKLVFCRKLSPLKQTKASQGHKQDFQNTPQFLWDLNRIISSLN